MPLSEEEIMRQLMSTFKAEADEHLDALNRQLLELEKTEGADDRQALLVEVFRDAHSLKGAARAVEATTIETTAHAMENVLAPAKRGELTLTATHFDQLYEGLDYISGALKAIVAGDQSPADNTELLARFEKSLSSEQLEGERAIKSGPKNGTGEARPKSSGGVEEVVRVSTRKLDALMTHVEELLVSKIRTEQRVSELKELKGALGAWQKSWQKVRGEYDRLRRQPDGNIAEIMDFLGENQENLKQFWLQTTSLIQDFSKDSMRMSLVTEDLQEDIRSVRMLPVAGVFESYRRMVRDLAREQGKQITLTISGENTELDKKLIEGVKDPLMHIIRNAVDHGIESPQERESAGKPATGVIKLQAGQHGNTIRIEVEDDGVGLDVEKIRAAAAKKNMMSVQEAKALSDEDARFLIFQSGFSTAHSVTNVSGRGVGLDVVKNNIEKLNGLVTIGTSSSGGTRITLSLPLTLSTSRILLVQVNDGTYAVPTSAVERIIRVNEADIFTIGDKNAIQVGGRSLSLVSVSDVLELPLSERKPGQGKIPVIILGAAEKRVAFAIDSLQGETEIVIKSLGRMMSRVRNVSGATILGSGKVVMILNAADMIKSAKFVGDRRRPSYGPDKEKSPDGYDNPQKTVELNQRGKQLSVLVVDDSVTTRIMEKNILESAGYSVSLANDGQEAFEALNQGEFDLVVSDVDMPRMDGFELTARVKESNDLKDVPVVLVTALDSAADKERGLECGADAYIVKHSFDQKNLLSTIEQLV